MIHIADTKVARRYGDFFIRQIHKFEEVIYSQIELIDLYAFSDGRPVLLYTALNSLIFAL